jgi:hypothetical protein
MTATGRLIQLASEIAWQEVEPPWWIEMMEYKRNLPESQE